MLNWIAIICSIPLLLLGAHGLYAYFYALDTISALAFDQGNKLFFAWGVPHSLSGLVSWMTIRGLQSLVIPGVFAACGALLLWHVFSHGLRFRLPRWSGNQRNSRQYEHQGGHSNVPRVYLRSTWQNTSIRILLNLSIVLGAALVVWYATRVFSHKTSPLLGALSLLLAAAAVVVLTWLLRKRFLWVKPSFKLTALCVAIVAVVFAFAGVEPFQGYKNSLSAAILDRTGRPGLSSPSSTTAPAQTMTLRVGSIPWQVTLKSVGWSGSRVTAQFAVTNKGPIPADFPYENVDPLGVVVDFGVLDSYGMWYATDGHPTFQVQKIYPGETRTYKPSFVVSVRSGNVSLYVTKYTGTSRMKLFDLGAPR